MVLVAAPRATMGATAEAEWAVAGQRLWPQTTPPRSLLDVFCPTSRPLQGSLTAEKIHSH